MWLPPVASMLSSDDDEAASASGAAVQMHDRRSIAEALRASNGQVLAEGQPSYHGAYTCIAKGLHVSRFSIGMDATEAHRRMSTICDGRLKRSNLLARPWSNMHVANVKGAMRVVERITAESTGFVSLHDAVHAFYGGELPEREFHHLVVSVARSVGFAAPVRNADLFDTENRDDKANFQLDNVYRKKRVLQSLLQGNRSNPERRTRGGAGFKDADGHFDHEAYDKTLKAETHDHVTATGYRLVATTHAQMDLGMAARRRLAADDEEPDLDFDTDEQPTRDAKLFVTVRNLKLQPSTPYEHGRNQLFRIQELPQLAHQAVLKRAQARQDPHRRQRC